MSNARNLANLLNTSGEVESNKLDDNAVHGRRRLNINGSMLIAQRGISFTGKTSSSYGIDRHETKIGTAGTWTLSQSSTAPEGFSKSYKVDCTTANSSLSAASNMLIQQRIEGQDLVQLKKGTSNAEKVTMSFWVRSAKTGTYVLEILDNDNDRHIAKTYSISTADTWEHKVITFDGDTSGALTHDNTASLEYNFWLVAGSNYTSGTLATSWGSTTTANRAVGQVNLADSTSNDFYITGVQLEVGTATPFEHRSFGEELALCQRYYQKTGNIGTNTEWFAGVATYAGFGTRYAHALEAHQDRGIVNVTFPVQMRARPTLTVYPGRSAVTNTAGNITIYNGNTSVTTSSKPQPDCNGLTDYFQGTSTDSKAYSFQYTVDAEL